MSAKYKQCKFHSILLLVACLYATDGIGHNTMLFSASLLIN